LASAIIRQIAIVVAIALVPALGQAFYLRTRVPWTAQARAADEIGIKAALALGEGAVWVDARPDHEFEEEHVPGAIQLNEDRWNELLPMMLEQWSPEKRVVVYCGTEQCNASREVARRLRKEAELTNVFILSGGWDAWKGARK